MTGIATRPTRQKVSLRQLGARRCVSQKVGYATREEAQRVAELMMVQDKIAPGCHFTPYRCDQCPEWHIYTRRIVTPPLPRES